MPRSLIQLREPLEFLSILDEAGAADPALDPNLHPHDLQNIYRWMLRGRRFDDRMVLLSRQGRIGNYPPNSGQEAASLGPAVAINRDDWIAPSFRELPALMHHGWPMHRLILGWWGGHEIGAQPPEGVYALPLCGPVAGQCLHAAGIAWGLKQNGSDRLAVCFIGDGGTSEGDFHEALNVAGVFRLPLVMIIQNNHWALSMPRSRQTASETLAQKAIAYGIPGMQVDGNDILAMIVATREAAKRARSGGGATLIEALTYRIGPHSTSDEPRRYRDSAEVEEWKSREPLLRFRKYLESRRILTEASHQLIETQIAEEIAAEVAIAEAYRPDPAEPFAHCFADVPAHLQSQLDEFHRGSRPIEQVPAAREPVKSPAREVVLPPARSLVVS